MVMSQTFFRRPAGFTLIEVMIVVAILGVIAAVAVPSYRSYLLRSNRAQAISVMLEVAARNERYFSNNGTYATSASTNCGSSVSCIPYSNELTKYSISVTPVTGLVTATPTGSYSDPECGSLSITPAGVKSSGSGTVENCWK